MGLVNRLTPRGEALAEALKLAKQLSDFPQLCMRTDRRSCYEQWGMPESLALEGETERGIEVLKSGETLAGATRFKEGAGRHGQF